MSTSGLRACTGVAVALKRQLAKVLPPAGSVETRTLGREEDVFREQETGGNGRFWRGEARMV